MSHNVFLLKHQNLFMQAPYLYPDIHWHMLIAGFGTGKSRSTIISVLYAVSQLQGKKDRDGHYARIIVAGYTLKHIKRTLLTYLLEDLKNSRTPYKYSDKDNTCTIGTVTIMFMALDQPENIFGEDSCLKGDTVVKTDTGEITIKDVKAGDFVLTRRGYKEVLKVWNKGARECLRLVFDNGKEIVCTAEHRFIDANNREIEAEQITQETVLLSDTGSRIHLLREEQAGKYIVYDIEVEDEHEYFANGVLVHNCCSFCDEADELPESTMFEALKAINERTRQQIEGWRNSFIGITTTSQGCRGIYKLYNKFKKDGIGFTLVHGRTQDNFYLSKQYVDALYKMYDENERKVFLEGEFVMVGTGRVFPGFTWERNFIPDDLDKYLMPNEKVYIGQDDNEMQSFCRGSAWIVRNGILHCIKSYDFNEMLDAPPTFRYDFPEQRVSWLPDPTSKKSFPAYSRALRDNNIKILYRNKSPNVEDSCFLLNKLCYLGRVVFHEMAKKTAEAVATAARDKDGKIGKGRSKGDWQHDVDSARYAVNYLVLTHPELKDIRKGLLTRIGAFSKFAEDEEERAQIEKDTEKGYNTFGG